MIASYLERIEYYGDLDPTAETLRALHERHLFTVPFENLDIHLGNPIVCDVNRFFDKIVTRRRGGFCYELNGLFAELLRQLGYDVTMLSARVRTGEGDFGPEFDHMALLVVAEGKRWLADVGFGDSFLLPMQMDVSEPQQDPAGIFRLEANGDQWSLFKDDTPEYLFTTTPRALSEFEPMCLYQQTSPDSPFTRKRVCSKATSMGRITLSNSRLIVTENGIRTETELADDNARANALREHFAILL